MSLRLDKGKYWILTYWSREGGKRIQEYIGLDESKAYARLIEVLRSKVKHYQDRLDEAEWKASQKRLRETEKQLNKV